MALRRKDKELIDKESNKIKAALYIRVSTDEQAKEGYSIDSQLEYIKSFITSQGWEVYDEYIDDGFSAKNLKRPEIQRLINDAKQQKFNVVVFYKLDRLVRSVRDLNDLLQLFDENHVGIRSVTEPFDTTTAIGRFLITLVAAIAQWERETISERVVINMTHKAEKGERNGGKAPFGYDLVDGKLTINEEEAKIVREMFNLYLSGKGIRQLAIYLQRYGVDKDIRTIGRMLDNPVYCGKIRWAKNSKMEEIITESDHPPIIPVETFEAAQKLRAKNSKEGKRATSAYHFSGVLRCARCGSALSGYFKKERGTKHYLCINKKNKGTCNLPMFTEKALTSVFLDSLSPDKPDRFLELINFDFDEQQDRNDIEEQKQELEKQLALIKKRKKNWLIALGNGTISEDEYKEMTKDDTNMEIMIKQKLEELVVDEKPINKDEILKIASEIPLLWNDASDFEKKSFVNELFSSIVVDVPHDYKRAPGRTPNVIIKEMNLK